MYAERQRVLGPHICFQHSMPLHSVRSFLIFEVRVIARHDIDIKSAVQFSRSVVYDSL